MRVPMLVLLVVVAAFLTGCGSGRGPYASTGDAQRDVRKAEESYQRAIALLDRKDDAAAEKALRDALGHDLYHGPAHNNLGVLLLRQGRLYDAAEEFEWARKLLPGHPEPRHNLALALERGGKHQEAIEAAQSALEVRPGHLGATKLIAWVSANEGIEDPDAIARLDAIIARATEPEWRTWAQTRRERLLDDARR